MSPIVVGIGAAGAGDDAVGLAVARAIAARGGEVHQVYETADAALVVALLELGRPLAIVDAMVGGGAPGTVARLEPRTLARGPRLLTAHGLPVADALALAAALYGEAVLDRIAIVGIAIAPPVHGQLALSPAVAAAVEPAADLALASAAGPLAG